MDFRFRHASPDLPKGSVGINRSVNSVLGIKGSEYQSAKAVERPSVHRNDSRGCKHDAEDEYHTFSHSNYSDTVLSAQR
jgi:hypothetical protein